LLTVASHSRTVSEKRAEKKTTDETSARSTAFTSRSESARDVAIGFSKSKCFPALAASTAS
jgi:hypothetical protein